MLSRCSLILTAVFLSVAAGPPAARAVPVPILENAGQVHPEVRFYSSQAGRNVYFTASAIVIDLGEAGREPEGESFASPAAGRARATQASGNSRRHAIRVALADRKFSGLIEPRAPFATRYHFRLGEDPALWRADVPAFGEVVYHDVEPGLDLVFRCDAGGVSYEVLADDERRREAPVFRVEGADEVVCDLVGASEYLISAPGIAAFAFRRQERPSAVVSGSSTRRRR